MRGCDNITRLMLKKRTYATCYVIWSLLLYNMLSTMHATVQDYSPLPFIAYFWVHLDCFFMCHLFAGWAVSKECMVLVCTLHRRRGLFEVPSQRGESGEELQSSTGATPGAFWLVFFPANEFVKILTDELEEWHEMDGPDCFFPWGLQSGSIRGTVPQFCKASPPGQFLGGKKRVRNGCGFILNLLYIFLETNIALWK